MSYTELQGSSAYNSKLSGAALEILIYEEDSPSEPIVGAGANLNIDEEFAKSPVEEAGNDGVDEYVDDRHTCRWSISAFWTPAWADKVLTRQDFIGRRFTVVVRVGPKRANAGTVVDVCAGAVISSVSYGHGPRGPRTMNLSGMAVRRYSGAEWAKKAGA